MKKSEVKVALEALKTIRVAKIEDKETRNALVADHLFLLGQNKQFDAQIKDLETAHLGAYEEERREVAKLQMKAQSEKDAVKKAAIENEMNSHEELFKAILGYNKAVEMLAKEEIEVPFPLDTEKFIEALDGQEYDLKLITDIYPLFKNV